VVIGERKKDLDQKKGEGERGALTRLIKKRKLWAIAKVDQDLHSVRREKKKSRKGM